MVSLEGVVPAGRPPLAGKGDLPHNLWQVEVAATRRIAPRIQRVSLYSPIVASMPAGPNIKLFIPPRGANDLTLPELDSRGRPVWTEPAMRPAIRTYSVRRLDRDACLLDVDFVLHDHEGPASRWATTAEPGARLILGGPGGRDVRPAANYVLAGDLSSLAAIANILENLPATAHGTVLIETPDEDDHIALDHPHGINVEWLRVVAGGSVLPQAVRDRIDWHAHPDTFLWVGGESDAVRQIRAFGRDEIGLDRRMILAVGYWKRGMSEDAYHSAHDNDRDADYHAVWHEERTRKVANG